MSTQVAIAVFYNNITKLYLENAVTFIDADCFVQRPQENKTKFYILHNHQGKMLVRAFDYETIGDGYTLLGLVHLGSTNKHAELIGTRLVSNPDSQPTDVTLAEGMNKWATNTALDHVLSRSKTDTASDRACVHDRVDSLRRYFESKVVDGIVTSPASFYSA